MIRQPVANRVLVRIDPIEEKVSSGGIVLATTGNLAQKENASESGVIIAMGPTVFNNWGVPGEFKVGDHVHFVRYSGAAVADPTNPDAPKLRVLMDEDILLVDSEDIK